MPLVETAASALGKTVASTLAAGWLGHRRQQRDAPLDLSALMETSIRDRFVRRKFSLQIAGIANDMAEKLETSFQHEIGLLPESEVAAALNVVNEILVRHASSDEELFRADADADNLVAAVMPDLDRSLHDADIVDGARFLARRVMEYCLRCHVELVRYNPQFGNRAAQESLGRLTRLSEDVATLLDRVPAEADRRRNAATFKDLYCGLVSTHFDQLELFGVDVRNYSPEMTLSIAYLALRVSETRHRSSRVRSTVARDFGASRRQVAETEDDAAGSNVETALANANRILIRGDAGSGKSTLLRWIAINAARASFKEALSGWNGRVPFLLKLRHYADRLLPPIGPSLGEALEMLSGEVPDRWVTDVFASGEALLLVDGVDELVFAQRAMVRTWLRKIIARYPSIVVIVTSRPAAASDRWLAADDFTPLMLERMTPASISRFIRKWHEAIGYATYLPCDRSAIPRYERRVLSRLESNPHLRDLATNPLMCAMLCALNLDRADDLPHDRIALYKAALDMLIERRDARRDVPAYRQVALAAQFTTSLLQEISWRLTIGNRSELAKSQVLDSITRRLKTMPRVEHEPDKVLAYLLDRSGVLRDVAEDRVSFIHRTFQEFLTAMEIAEADYIDALIDHAHRDMWRETVIMTAGLASNEYRSRLIDGLLDRAESGPARYTRRLRLLAAACIETAPALPERLIARIDASLELLVPPRNRVEAQSLALAGQRVIRFLPDGGAAEGALSESVVAAIISTCAYVGGPAALKKIESHRADDRPKVMTELLASADFFDPETYGRVVLADSPLEDGWVNADAWRAPMLKSLTKLYGVRTEETDLAPVLAGLTNLRGLKAWTGDIPAKLDNLGVLREMPLLEVLEIGPEIQLDQLPTELPELRNLNIMLKVQSLSWLERYPELEDLSLYPLEGSVIRDATVLSRLRKLRGLVVYGRALSDLRFLRNMESLKHLRLSTSSSAIFRYIGAGARNLEALWLENHSTDVIDFAPLQAVSLQSLTISNLARRADVSSLAGHPSLREVVLRTSAGLDGIGALATIPHLELADLHGSPKVDLTGFSGRSGLRVVVGESCEVVNGDGVTVEVL
ncbi:NACHT domain-containing protein [Actinoplanes sp. NPDC000266]